MSQLIGVAFHHLTNCLSHHLPSYTTSELTVRKKYSYSCNTPLMGKGRETMRVLKKKMSSRAMVNDSYSSSSTSTATDRPLANFHSTIWGDYFLSYTPELTKINIQEKDEHEELKEKVRQMLVETPNNSTQKLVLIDTIQRLGVAYHFQDEIQTSIQHIFDVYQQTENDEDNLYVAALRFRLLRQQRHYMSTDVFKKFTNHDGKFKEDLTKDVQGLLSLYEAAHLRVHGEEILEEAMTFTVIQLESMVPYLSDSLKAQVSEALKHPIHTYLPRLTARKFICMYEKIESNNDSLLKFAKLELLKFAKLDFNMLQRMHQRELGELTRWWKDLDFAKQFPYARDRLVECYFWTVAPLYFESQHSRARKMLTKVLTIFTVIDDTYDAYATYEELVLFTDAIDRFDDSAMLSLPSNLRPAYRALLDCCNEIEEKLTKEGKLDRLNNAKYEMKRLCRAYFKEAQWLNAGHIPKCEEYMEDAAITSATVPMIATTSLCVMEEPTSKATFEWLKTEPLILRGSTIINRLKDDINSHSFEQQRSHVASFIECYMKEFGASKQEAYAEAQKRLNHAWKDMNKDFLSSSEVPMSVLELVINLARLAYIFEQDDFINTASEFKGIVSMLFVEPVDI